MSNDGFLWSSATPQQKAERIWEKGSYATARMTHRATKCKLCEDHIQPNQTYWYYIGQGVVEAHEDCMKPFFDGKIPIKEDTKVTQLKEKAPTVRVSFEDENDTVKIQVPKPRKRTYGHPRVMWHNKSTLERAEMFKKIGIIYTNKTSRRGPCALRCGKAIKPQDRIYVSSNSSQWFAHVDCVNHMLGQEKAKTSYKNRRAPEAYEPVPNVIPEVPEPTILDDVASIDDLFERVPVGLRTQLLKMYKELLETNDEQKLIIAELRGWKQGIEDSYKLKVGV